MAMLIVILIVIVLVILILIVVAGVFGSIKYYIIFCFELY